METKKCTTPTCNESRLEMFSINKANPGGLAYKCKTCMRGYYAHKARVRKEDKIPPSAREVDSSWMQGDDEARLYL